MFNKVPQGEELDRDVSIEFAQIVFEDCLFITRNAANIKRVADLNDITLAYYYGRLNTYYMSIGRTPIIGGKNWHELLYNLKEQVNRFEPEFHQRMMK